MTYPVGTAALAIQYARDEIGYVEVPDNITKYGEFTKAQGLPWCGSFCNWVLAQAEVKAPSVVGTAAGAHKFKEIGRWHDKPEVGDLAFMDFPHDGVDRISHVGIVIAINGQMVQTIEGNTSGNGDQRNGGMVMVKMRTIGKEVVGFGRPKYKPYKGDMPAVAVPEAEPKKKLLKKGAKK